MSGPYATAAMDYFDAGWSPLPLGGLKGKTPLVSGRHGDNPYASKAEVERWIGLFPNANIGLRLPKGTVGIDVDCYDGKPGAPTLADAEARWGALPPTWVSTSRTDGSGIHLYQAPENLDWPGILGPGVEIIHWANRFIVAAPSLHHTGNRYRWISPAGIDAIDEIPRAGEL